MQGINEEIRDDLEDSYINSEREREGKKVVFHRCLFFFNFYRYFFFRITQDTFFCKMYIERNSSSLLSGGHIIYK